MFPQPAASVIIPVYSGERTLPRVLAALEPQVTGDPDVEVIVVDSTGDGSDVELARQHPWLRVLALPRRVLPGTARNLGAREALGGQLVFLDADTVPSADWLSRLRAAAADDVVAVAGAVANGTPHDAVGTASYLLEFAELMPSRGGQPVYGASGNLLVDRGSFEAAGGFPEDLWPGEDTILTAPWAARGRVAFSRQAVVWHLNRSSLGELIRHQHRLGRAFARVCDSVDFPHARFTRWPLLPAAPAVQLAALALRLKGKPRTAARAVLLAPLLLVGLLAWTLGLVSGRRAAVAR